MDNALTKLAALAALQHDAAMAELSRHNHRIHGLQSRISDLRHRRQAPPAPDPNGGLPLSLASGHHCTWQRWLEQELTRLNTDLARARADREAVIQNARRAFGRKSATDALLHQETQAKRMAARKRLEQSASQDHPGKNPLFF